MKLFYASGTSAMAPHILLTDAGLDFSLARVNLDRKTLLARTDVAELHRNGIA